MDQLNVTVPSAMSIFCNFSGNYSSESGTLVNDRNCNLTMQQFADGNKVLIYDLISVIVPILFGIIVIVGFIGNALVVTVMLSNPQIRNTTNLLILNLAIADLLFIILCVPFTAWDYAFPYWPFGDTWCRCVQFLIVVSRCCQACHTITKLCDMKAVRCLEHWM